MKIFNLAIANIRNAKSASVFLFILIFLAALLLNIGMTIMSKLDTFYDDKSTELHDAHVALVVKNSDYKQEYEDFLRSYSGVKETEIEDTILMTAANIPYGDSNMSIGAVFLDADSSRNVFTFKLIEKLDSYITNEDIYLPFSFKAGGGFQLGDIFTLTYKDLDYSYRVAGFFETTMLGTFNMGIMKFFLSDTSYRDLSEALGEDASGKLMSVILTDSNEAPTMYNNFDKQFLQSEAENNSMYIRGVDFEMVKTANSITISIVSMILVAFAAIIVLVSLIVIKFRVTNSIEDGMVNIGVLKALGFTSKQILSSILLQFLMITFFAGLVGVMASYAVLPLFGGVIAALSGLLWTQSFSLTIQIMSIVIVIVLVLVVTLVSALRIRKLPPVAALRGGIQNHNFKRNPFPLENSKGGLNFLLAGKTMIMNRKQNFMITLIVAAITFASVFALVLYYNIAEDKTAFIHLVGAESSNVIVVAKSGENSEQLMHNIEQMAGVEKVTVLDQLLTRIEGKSFYTQVSDDFSRMNNNTVFEGRYPKYDNEISISWLVSKELNKGIGDTVTVELGDVSYDYLVTGLSQSINNMGQLVELTLPGMRHLVPDYTASLFNVYLKDIDNPSFIQELKLLYGDMTEDIIDADESMMSQIGTYISTVFFIMMIIFAITILVVVLILYLVTNTMILKRKKELGIMRAIGFTTYQLMNQIALNFVPVVMVGVAIGSVLGSLYTNSILALLLSSAGIRNVHFTVNVPDVLVLSMVIIALAYIVSMLVSRRIKKISAYSLITE